MMKQIVKFLLIILLATPLAGAVISACSEEDICGSTRHMFVCVAMREHPNILDSLIKDTLPSLSITAVGSDSIILNNMGNVTEFSLPLEYTHDTTSLVFHYRNSVTDTIIRARDTVTIIHTNAPYFLSVECGFEIKQEIIEVSASAHELTDIITNKSTVSNDGTPNLYFIY